MKKHLIRNCGWTLLLAALSGPTAVWGETSWKAGVAKVDITPQESIWMAGYGNRKKPSEGIRKRIHATALALQEGQGAPAVLVTFDLESIERDWSEAVAERCRKQFGLTRDRLAMNVSHTHSGPVVGTMPPYYAPMTPAQVDIMRRYTQKLSDQTVALVGEAIAKLSPATLDFEQGLAGIAVNRRRARDRALPGPVDQDVPVLRVSGPHGELRAIVVGYACHATSMNDYLMSGDWPGYAKQEIEDAHPGAVALFVQGCGADSNPLPRYQGTDPALLPYAEALPRMYGKILAAAVDLVLHGKMKPLNGPLSSALDVVGLPMRPRDGKLPASYPYTLQVWQFGRDLKFIIMSGEVVVDYALRLKGRYGWDNTWVAGYSNDVVAYIPSLRVLREGGYEGGGANQTLSGLFTEDVEEIVSGKVNDLINRTTPR